ncbi:voltage-gated chloride channel family protein [Pedobacter aquae]|nr:voltage-gated chloride channel family protein [Pedobacter aquae]
MMNDTKPKLNQIEKLKQLTFLDNFLGFRFLLKWLFICSIVGALSGTASAWFLMALNWATNFREQHVWIIAFLPLAGMLIIFLYEKLNKEASRGNNLIIEEIHQPKKKISFWMAPLIFIGTVATHLFGGSAGREGSAVQMGAALADETNSWLKLKKRDRRILLMCGVSAGFASLFGTPLAATLFALEVFLIGTIIYEAILPCLLAAVIAYWVCNLWDPGHSHYIIQNIPDLNVLNILIAVLAGILFGLTGRLFANTTHYISSCFKQYIPNMYAQPVIGACMVICFLLIWGDTQYIGLGLDTIENAFHIQQPYYGFIIKILLTAITLGAGFKGGEVTPLFFIGATLGSALSGILPLPIDLLSGMGFVAVFTAAANTPLACILMGIELFGASSAVYIAISCVVAYLFSGHNGIYGSQKIGSAKHPFWIRQSGKNLSTFN